MIGILFPRPLFPSYILRAKMWILSSVPKSPFSNLLGASNEGFTRQGQLCQRLSRFSRHREIFQNGNKFGINDQYVDLVNIFLAAPPIA